MNDYKKMLTTNDCQNHILSEWSSKGECCISNGLAHACTPIKCAQSLLSHVFNYSNQCAQPLLSHVFNHSNQCAQFWMFLNPVVKHIFREVNQCTDALAKLGATFVASSVVFYNSPLVVENFLAFDNVELYIL